MTKLFLITAIMTLSLSVLADPPVATGQQQENPAEGDINNNCAVNGNAGARSQQDASEGGEGSNARPAATGM